MTQEELIEQLADKEHSSWGRWMQYLFATCQNHNDGSVTIPTDLVLRWSRQADTPYADLSEREKQSDRDEVAHILPIIEEYANKLMQQIESKHINHVLDQYAVAQAIARMEKQISRINTEIFATRITKHSDKLDQGTVRRQTLLGRVDELSGMAALGPVDQSFFLE